MDVSDGDASQVERQTFHTHSAAKPPGTASSSASSPGSISSARSFSAAFTLAKMSRSPALRRQSSLKIRSSSGKEGGGESEGK